MLKEDRMSKANLVCPMTVYSLQLLPASQIRYYTKQIACPDGFVLNSGRKWELKESRTVAEEL